MLELAAGNGATDADMAAIALRSPEVGCRPLLARSCSQSKSRWNGPSLARCRPASEDSPPELWPAMEPTQAPAWASATHPNRECPPAASKIDCCAAAPQGDAPRSLCWQPPSLAQVFGGPAPRAGT